MNKASVLEKHSSATGKGNILFVSLSFQQQLTEDIGTEHVANSQYGGTEN